MKNRIAVASTDGKVINQHFGKAADFYIIEADSETKKLVYKKKITVTPVCDSGDHDDKRMIENIQKLKECQYILVSKIGYRAQALLEQSGFLVFELPGVIDESVARLLQYIEVQNLISEQATSE